MTDIYRRDPMFQHVVKTGESTTTADHLTPSQVEGLRRHGIPEMQEVSGAELSTHVVAPILGIGETIGVVQFWPPVRATKAARADMDRVCALTALRFAQLGICRPIYSPELAAFGPRQLEVVRLVARGYTNAEVAGALEISIDTVKKHLKGAFARLGVVNRTELAVMVDRCTPRIDDPIMLPEGYHAVAIDVHRPPRR
jgi:DNA-binding CsgD family transcriptional regulator